ncbi:hypothetical protein [Syntrophobacter fumaroxidans]|nr:hypothetical protein [Syntrophobacter fumaroxidans]
MERQESFPVLYGLSGRRGGAKRGTRMKPTAVPAPGAVTWEAPP